MTKTDFLFHPLGTLQHGFLWQWTLVTRYGDDHWRKTASRRLEKLMENRPITGYPRMKRLHRGSSSMSVTCSGYKQSEDHPLYILLARAFRNFQTLIMSNRIEAPSWSDSTWQVPRTNILESIILVFP